MLFDDEQLEAVIVVPKAVPDPRATAGVPIVNVPYWPLQAAPRF